MNDLPIFPLNAVLFPGGLLPLRIFEARYMDMTRECMRENTPFGICLIREGAEVGAPAIPEAMGCLAHIVEWDMQELGVLQLKTRGGERFTIRERRVAEQGLIRAEVELVEQPEPVALPQQYDNLAKLLVLVLAERGAASFAEPHAFDDAAWVGYRLTEILPVSNVAKQKLLELDDSLARLEILQRYLAQRGLADK